MTDNQHICQVNKTESRKNKTPSLRTTATHSIATPRLLEEYIPSRQRSVRPYKLIGEIRHISVHHFPVCQILVRHFLVLQIPVTYMYYHSTKVGITK